MFDKLANFIVKRHKAILVMWIVLLALAVPFAIQISSVISYEETSDLPKDAESERARAMMDERFSDSVSNSSIVVIVKCSNVTDERTRDFTLSLEERSKGLDGIASFTSVYNAYEQAINYSSALVGPTIFSTEKNASQLAQMMYASPLAYSQAYAQLLPNVNATASGLFGAPSAYLGSWSAIYQQMPMAPIEMVNGLARDSAYGAMSPSLNASEQFFISSYLDAFNSTWTQTFNYSNALFLPNATSLYDRASFVTNVTAPRVFGFEPADTQEKQFMRTVFYSFGLSDWANVTEQAVVASELANSTSWSAISSNMQNATHEQIFIISSYHYAFHSAWLGSIYQLPATAPETRAKICVDQLAPAFFGFNVSTSEQNSSASQFTYDVWRDCGIANFTDVRVAHLLAIRTIGRMSGMSASFLENIYLLGERPNASALARLARSTIINGTIWTYPVQIPARYLEKMVVPEHDMMMIVLEFSTADSDVMGNNVIELREILSEMRKEANADGGAKISTYVTGSAAISLDTESTSLTDMLIIEPVTIALILVLISFFFLSVVTPFIPLVNAGVGLLVSQAVLFIVGSTFFKIHYLVVFILIAMILAAGSDYSIFIIARYREERVKGKSREDAVRTSLTWAGESIATSGLTVMIGAGALAFMNFSIARTMGIAFMLGIGVALLVNLTLLPSLMLVLGNRIFWPSRNKWKGGSKFAEEYKKKRARHDGYFSKSARFSIKYSKAIVLACILLAIPSVYAINSVEMSFDFIGIMPSSESKQGMDTMSEGFGAGNIMPTYVVVELPREIRSTSVNGTKYDMELMDSLETFCSKLEDVGNVASVSGPSRPLGFALNFSDESALEQYYADLEKTIGSDNRTVIITVVLTYEPMTKRSVDTIPELRNKAASAKADDPRLDGAKILIGGETAAMNDLEDMTMNDFKTVVVFVTVGIFIVLLAVLRSVMIPLRLILTILLSISWSLALTMLIFQMMLNLPIIWLMPVILFSILMGLGMDYDIFLCTRIREEYLKGKTDEQSIIIAVEETGGIITICGAIMVGALASMLLSGMGLLQEFGFGLGFAILVDATIVRIYLVPAIMVMLKKWNWWMPGGLQRVKTDDRDERPNAKEANKPFETMKPGKEPNDEK